MVAARFVPYVSEMFKNTEWFIFVSMVITVLCGAYWFSWISVEEKLSVQFILSGATE